MLIATIIFLREIFVCARGWGEGVTPPGINPLQCEGLTIIIIIGYSLNFPKKNYALPVQVQQDQVSALDKRFYNLQLVSLSTAHHFGMAGSFN